MSGLVASSLLILFVSEKYALLDHSDLIVRGSLQNIRYLSSAKNWRAEAELVVLDSIRGKVGKGDKLRYVLDCSCCAIQASEQPLESLGRDGLWLLRKDRTGHWTSAGGCGDPGWRDARDREGWRRAVQNSPRQGMQKPKRSP